MSFKGTLKNAGEATISKVIGLDGFYVLSPGAGWTGRQWPTGNFRHLARMIYEASGLTGVICGSGGEEPLGVALADIPGAPMLNLVGRTQLDELAHIISKARFVIGNESGAIHLAASVSTPSVCLLGGGHFGRFMPYRLEVGTERPLPVPVNLKMDCFGCNWRCKHKIPAGAAVPCIKDITVEMAWEAVKTVLNKRPGQ